MKSETQLPSRVSVYEVSPRDGFQNESVTVPTTQKLRLIQALVDSGLTRIEVASFVSPEWIPQLSDSDQVARLVQKLISDHPNVQFSALCPNMKGLERALAAGISEIAVFVSVSETHNKKNVNRSVRESLDGFRPVIKKALSQNVRVRGYISTLWGCPYEGHVDPQSGLNIGKELLQMGCYQLSLGDTIGVGTPRQTADILELFLKDAPTEAVALHMHDTRGTALANILVGLEYNITTFDASVGGMGGCPYAPGAAGNVASEDLVYMFQGMGIETGVDLEKLWEAGQVARSIVGRELPGKVHKASVRGLRY